jgi:hypothetical protein
MRKKIVLVLCFALLTSSSCFAQRVVHDAKRDAQAQAAASASKDLLNGSIFEAQLKNLEQLGTQQLETVMRWQEVKMRAALNGFTKWSDVTKVLDRVDNNLEPFLDVSSEQGLAAQRLEEIKTRAAQIPKLLQDLQAKSPNHKDIVDDILSHVGDAKQVVDFAERTLLKDNAAKVKALNEVVATLEQVQNLYASVKGILTSAAAVSVPVASLRPDPLQTELELLRVEGEHLKILGLIRARQALEVGEMKKIVDDARSYVNKFPPDEPIEITLANLKTPGGRNDLEFALYALHYAAAVAAQQETSADLASLRKSLEERRYSIQRSAVNAGTYEQTVRAVADRLALYWKSGFKPKDLAELLYHLSTAASLPILAGKQ